MTRIHERCGYAHPPARRAQVNAYLAARPAEHPVNDTGQSLLTIVVVVVLVVLALIGLYVLLGGDAR